MREGAIHALIVDDIQYVIFHTPALPVVYAEVPPLITNITTEVVFIHPAFIHHTTNAVTTMYTLTGCRIQHIPITLIAATTA